MHPLLPYQNICIDCYVSTELHTHIYVLHDVVMLAMYVYYMIHRSHLKGVKVTIIVRRSYQACTQSICQCCKAKVAKMNNGMDDMMKLQHDKL